MAKATQLRNFKKMDWEGMAGCEEFPDGRQPMVAYVNYWEGRRHVGGATVVVDANGLGVMLTTEDGEDLGHFDLPQKGLTRDALEAIGNALIAEQVTEQRLIAFGLEKE